MAEGLGSHGYVAIEIYSAAGVGIGVGVVDGLVMVGDWLWLDDCDGHDGGGGVEWMRLKGPARRRMERKPVLFELLLGMWSNATRKQICSGSNLRLLEVLRFES